MSEEKKSFIEAICLGAYEKTASFYEKLAPQMGDRAHGYKILYAPPKIEAPILFFGYQPGGGARDAIDGERAGERIRWPEKSEYAIAGYPLAVAMRAIWSSSILRESVGLNSIFFRSPKKDIWKSTLPRHIRVDAEAFCHVQSRSIIDALRPRTVVMFGFGNVPDFKSTGEPLRAATSRLIQPGTIWGYPAAEVIHLSGARISNDNRRRIVDYFNRAISD